MRISSKDELMASLDRCQPVSLLDIQKEMVRDKYMHLPKTYIAYTQLKKGGIAD